MKKKVMAFACILMASYCFFSCDSRTASNSSEEKPDSITAKLKYIDSLRNSGTYYHLESWNIGRIIDNEYKEYESLADRHSVEIYVNRLLANTDTLYFLQLKYWTTTSYSESIENKIIDIEELKSFYIAIDDIKRQYGKDSNHYELFVYQTKGEASLALRHLINSNIWDLNFCSIDINKADLDELKLLLKKAEKKVKEIKAKAK